MAQRISPQSSTLFLLLLSIFQQTEMMSSDYSTPIDTPEGAPPAETKEQSTPSTLVEGAAVTLVKEGTKDEGVHYSAQLRSDWCIGVVPHGGYLTTVLINVSTHYFIHSSVAKALDQPHAIHSALTFITRCSIGPATIHVTPLKLGRQYSFVRIVLRQNGHVCIDATITHACISRETGATLETRGMGAYPDLPDRVRDCKEMRLSQDPSLVFRVATSKLKYCFPIEGKYGFGRAGMGPSIREQWVALDDGSGKRFGVADLGFLCDMFIPIPENYPQTKRLHWYPTLSLSLDVKALPPKEGWEWLYCRIESSVIRGGRMDIDVVICDEDSNIVAISRHVAVVVDSARNTAKQAPVAKL